MLSDDFVSERCFFFSTIISRVIKVDPSLMAKEINTHSHTAFENYLTLKIRDAQK